MANQRLIFISTYHWQIVQKSIEANKINILQRICFELLANANVTSNVAIVPNIVPNANNKAKVLKKKSDNSFQNKKSTF